MGVNRTRLTCTLPQRGTVFCCADGTERCVLIGSEMVTPKYNLEGEGIRRDTLVSSLSDGWGKDTAISYLSECYRKTNCCHLSVRVRE